MINWLHKRSYNVPYDAGKRLLNPLSAKYDQCRFQSVLADQITVIKNERSV